MQPRGGMTVPRFGRPPIPCLTAPHLPQEEVPGVFVANSPATLSRKGLAMIRGLQSVRLGFVPISKFVFSQEDAARYKALVQERLGALGVDFVSIDGLTSDGMLYLEKDLPGVVAHLRAHDVDAVFCPHCNFGTEDVAAKLGREMGLPYLLWGPRDEMPLPDGTRLRDTQCGLFATSKILRQMNVPFTYIPNCRMDDPVLDRGILSFLQVASVVKTARKLRIGQVGQRNDFFWTVMVNETGLLEKLGIEVYQVYISDIVERMRELLADPTDELLFVVQFMHQQVTFESLGPDQVKAIAALKIALGEVAERHGLSAIALQCFPVMQKEFGIYPCYAHSLLTVEGVPVICESDIYGAIAAILLQAATLHENPPFFADLTNRHPENDNAELLWHCGSFPICLADDGVKPKVGEHFIMPGAEAGVGHWRVRGGDVTIARFASDGDRFLLGFGQAKGTSGPSTVGTYLWVEMNDWLQWERAFIRGPYIHHVAVVHGAVAAVLQEACRYIPGMQADPIDPGAEALEEHWWRV
jgi:L-fucose isomerase-like protein